MTRFALQSSPILEFFHTLNLTTKFEKDQTKTEWFSTSRRDIPETVWEKELRSNHYSLIGDHNSLLNVLVCSREPATLLWLSQEGIGPSYSFLQDGPRFTVRHCHNRTIIFMLPLHLIAVVHYASTVSTVQILSVRQMVLCDKSKELLLIFWHYEICMVRTFVQRCCFTFFTLTQIQKLTALVQEYSLSGSLLICAQFFKDNLGMNTQFHGSHHAGKITATP